MHATALLSSRNGHFLNIHLVTARQFTIEAVTSYPCPSELTSASTGTGIAWAFNEQGKGTCM